MNKIAANDNSREAHLAIAEVTALMPDLCISGMKQCDRESDRDWPVEQVDTAICFLRQCRPLKKPNLGSYGLKHAAERWGQDHGMSGYVPNGALILAAVYLNFNIEWSGRGPNVDIAVSVKDVQRLDPGCLWSRKYWRGRMWS